MKNDIVLRPSYWASVSGGKDSLYMLMLILANPRKYPLDGVVHYELEVDYPFIKDVVNLMEEKVKPLGIPFIRIKPRDKWNDLYNKYGFPTRAMPWCRNRYKLDAQIQLKNFLKEKGCYLVNYIGLCADETERFENKGYKDVYPLVDFGIEESTILSWAKTEPIFNNYYITNKRCGCMLCPQASRMNMAYTLKYYPDQYSFMIEAIKITEHRMEHKTGKKFCCMDGHAKYNAEYIDSIIKTKWLAKLEEIEREYNE